MVSENSRTAVSCEIDWEVTEILFWEETRKPSEDRQRDILADVTPGSVLNIKSIELLNLTWSDEVHGWLISGRVRGTYTSIRTEPTEDILEKPMSEVFPVLNFNKELTEAKIKSIKLKSLSTNEIILENDNINMEID